MVPQHPAKVPYPVPEGLRNPRPGDLAFLGLTAEVLRENALKFYRERTERFFLVLEDGIHKL